MSFKLEYKIFIYTHYWFESNGSFHKDNPTVCSAHMCGYLLQALFAHIPVLSIYLPPSVLPLCLFATFFFWPAQFCFGDLKSMHK